MTQTQHPLFAQFPLQGQRETSAGSVPVPYHVYDGHGVLIGGTAGLEPVRELLQGQAVYPIETITGRALMGIWVLDFTEASLGPHRELQFSILVSHQPAERVADHPFALLKSLLVDEGAAMFCYRLWNDSATAVAYNRELLALPAAPATAEMERDDGQLAFAFAGETGGLLCSGNLQMAPRPSLRAVWSLLRLLGVRQAASAFSRPYLEAAVVNPVGLGLDHNARARSLLAAGSPIVRFYDPATDRIALGKAYRSAFGFRPHFVEQFEPFRFVYLQPDSEPAAT